MAVTILSTPQDYTPSGNPVVFTFSSDQTAQANFSYLVEVYVDGTLRGRQQIFPESGVRARIDCTSYAESYTSAPVVSTDIQTDAGNYAEIYVTVIERYGDPIADGASATSSTIKVFKARLSDIDFINWDSSLYEFGSGALYLNTFPREERLLCGNDEQLRLLSISDSVANVIIIELYDENGGLITDDSEPVTAADIVMLSIGPQNIIDNTGITQDNFDASAYYTINLSDGAAQEAELITVYIDRICKRETHKRLHFISSYGSIESFTYNLYSTETGNIETQRYESEFGGWTSGGFEFTLNQGRIKDYHKRVNKELLLRSNWIKEPVQQWLEKEVSIAPLSYIEDSNDTNLGLRRVAIKKNQFRFKTTKQDTQFREDLTLIIDTHTSMSL